MRFKALLAGAVLCFAGAPALAATYIGTFPAGVSSLDLGTAQGRSVRATIRFNAPVTAYLRHVHYKNDDVLDRRTGAQTHRSDYRIDGYGGEGITEIKQYFTGYSRRYYRNLIYFDSIDSRFDLHVESPNTVNYVAIINSSGVPEPSTWAMMILGIGLAGGALRRRQLNSKLIPKPA